jgi:hypothetical protein
MGALSQARSKGYKIVPSCWFVRDIMSASSKYDDLWLTALPNRGYCDAQAEQG